MENLIVKPVNVLGNSIMAAKDEKGNIFAGVSYFCNALGMTKGQKDKQVQKVQKDEVLKQGCFRLEAGVFDPSNEAIALRIDFVPLWLAKIQITDKTKQDNPGLAKKLLDYQLQAKDILAAAFLPKQESTGDIQGQIRLLAQGTTELYEKVGAVEKSVDSVKNELETLKNDLPILPIEAEKITNAVKAKGVHIMGGKASNAYHNRSIVQAVYCDIYGQIYRNFEIKSYKALKRCQTDKAIEIINDYKAPVMLQDRIDNENAQQKFQGME